MKLYEREYVLRFGCWEAKREAMDMPVMCGRGLHTRFCIPEECGRIWLVVHDRPSRNLVKARVCGNCFGGDAYVRVRDMWFRIRAKRLQSILRKYKTVYLGVEYLDQSKGRKGR